MMTPKQKAVLEFIERFSATEGYCPSQQEIAQHFGFKSLGTVQNYLVRLERHGFLRKAWNAKRGMSVLRDPLDSSAAVMGSASMKKYMGSASLLGSSTTTPSSLKADAGVDSLIPSRSEQSRGSLEKTGAVPPPSDRSTVGIASLAEARAARASVVTLPVLGRVAAGLPIEYAEFDQTVEVPLSLFARPMGTSHRESFADSHYVLRVKGDSMIGDGILDGDYVIIEKGSAAEQGQTVVAMIGNEATIKRFYKKRNQVELRAANPAYEPILVDSLTESRDFRIEGVLVGLIRKL